MSKLKRPTRSVTSGSSKKSNKLVSAVRNNRPSGRTTLVAGLLVTLTAVLVATRKLWFGNVDEMQQGERFRYTDTATGSTNPYDDKPLQDSVIGAGTTSGEPDDATTDSAGDTQTVIGDPDETFDPEKFRTAMAGDVNPSGSTDALGDDDRENDGRTDRI